MWPSQSTIYTHPLKAWAGLDEVLGFGHLAEVGGGGQGNNSDFLFLSQHFPKSLLLLILAFNKGMKR